MKLLIKYVIIFLITISISFVYAFSQDTVQIKSEQRNFKIHLTSLSTISISNIPEAEETLYRFFFHSIAFQKNKNAIEFKYNGAKPVSFLPDFGLTLWPNNEFYEVSAIYQRYFNIPNIHSLSFSIGAGISYYERIKRGNFVWSEFGFGSAYYYDKIKINGIGFPMEGTINIHLGKHFALKNVLLLTLYNKNELFAMYALCLGYSFNIQK